MKPIPVKAAADIASEYGKGVVVIVAFDDERVFTTTYGVTQNDKVIAASLGELFTAKVGGDMNRIEVFEDLPEYLKKKSHDV